MGARNGRLLLIHRFLYILVYIIYTPKRDDRTEVHYRYPEGYASGAG